MAFWPVVAGTRSFLHWDLRYEVVPLWHVSGIAIRSGHWPFWIDGEYCGHPALLRQEVALFYPLTAPLLATGAPAHRLADLFTLFHLWLAGFAAYLLVRDVTASQPAALFGGLAWMLSGRLVQSVLWPNAVAVSALLPLIFLGVLRIGRGRRRSGVVFAAAFGGLALLAREGVAVAAARPAARGREASGGGGVIRAVLFDAGATLLRPDPPVEAVYAREFAADGARFSEEDLLRALTRAWKESHAAAGPNRYGGVRGEAEYWKELLGRVRSHLDGGTVSPEAFARLAAHFRSPEAWAIYDDVMATLEDLRRRDLKLAIVSNWDSYLPKLLAALDLDRFFPVLAVSAIEEVGKPDPEIFRRACERLGVSAEEALHVGDSLTEDYEGARGAGLSALLLDRADRHPGVVERIRSLHELAERLS